MPVRDVVTVGGSAGSIGVIKQIVHALPASLPASVFVVIHISARTRSLLAEILNSSLGSSDLRAGGPGVSTLLRRTGI